MSRLRAGFTFIEVAVSIAILVIGITASMSLLITGINWATEAKINFSATDAAETVLQNPRFMARVVRPADPVPSNPDFTDDEIKGYFNGYFFVRTVDRSSIKNIAHNGGYSARVRVEAYHGGDDQDGEKVVDFYARVYVAP